jgi:hypothetical protein
MKVMKHTADRPAISVRRTAGRRVLSIGLLALVASGIACKARKDAPAAPPQIPADTTPAEAAAPAPVVAAPAEAVRPACDQFQLTENGAAAVLIGDPRDSVRARCSILSDSTTTDGEGKIQGNVVVGVSGSPVVVEIANDRVYRLAVTDPQFRTADGLGPGMPLSQVMQLPGAVVLEGMHDLSIVVSAHCGLYFRIPKPAAPPENGGRWTDVVAALPQGTPVERVVVHGCRSPAAS